MKFVFLKKVLRFLSLSWLTGPLFDKELRVSSRHRRNYVLRFVYVILMTFFIAITWISEVKYQGTTAFQKSRMAVAGKTIVTTILMFQFFTTQLVSIIMLSTSISDEIYNRTLGVLMTTPISSFQIVMGKLFSKLMQLILLLAISLPMLAIVRIFGGVPWNYILSSLCITLTAVIFDGALSLYFSIGNRRAYVVIMKTIVAIGVLFFFIPMLASVTFVPVRLRRVAAFRTSSPLFSILAVAFLHLNPFAAIIANSTLTLSPTGALPGNFFYWPIHCIFMLAASVLLIVFSVHIVRRVALRQATGQPEFIKPKNGLLIGNESLLEQTGLVRPVTGSPVLWKELRTPIIQGGEGKNSIIGFLIAVAALLITYAVCIHQRNLDDDFTHASYVVMFVIIGSIFNMVLSATCITSEKESRAWPILLATSMDELYILIGKAVGVFRRCSPVWILLTAHVIVFVMVGYIHPIAIVHVFLIVSGLIVFLTGVGIYFSSRFQRTTSAVVANFGFILIIWFVIPVLLGFVSEFFRRNEMLYTTLGVCVSANPAAQANIVMSGDGGISNASSKLSSLAYNWPHSRRGAGVWQTSRNLLFTATVYTVTGLFFAWRAMCRFRRSIF